MSVIKDENDAVSITTTTCQSTNSVDRRKTLKKLGIGGALVTGAKWTSPIVVSVSLPAHAQTTGTTTTTLAGTTTTTIAGTTTTTLPGTTTTTIAGTTTTTTTTTTAPMGCSAPTCTSSSTAGFGFIGGLVFDGSSCFIQFDVGPAAILLGDPNLIFFADNNAAGSRIVVIGNVNWSISGLGVEQVFGVLGSGSESRTFTAINNQTSERFEFCLRISRIGDAQPAIDHITYTVDIGPL